jgi:putative oxidoreductase
MFVMMGLRSRLDTLAYSAMRVVVAVLYLAHGLRWLFGVFGGPRAHLFSLFWAAGMIETTCGTLVALGIYAAPAAFVASGEMAVAYFIAHAPRGSLPIRNGGELAVTFCFVFLYIAMHGAGPLNVNRLRRRNA